MEGAPAKLLRGGLLLFKNWLIWSADKLVFRDPDRGGFSKRRIAKPPWSTGALVGTASASFSRACSIFSRAPGTAATMRSTSAATFCSLK